MLFLLLRLFIAPLAVLAGTLAQRRFGHAVGGIIIGLPLTSLPMLLLVALQHGTAFATSMSNADLVGSLAEVAVILVYVRLAPRISPTMTLVSALGAFTVTAGVIHLFTFSTVLAGLIAIASFTVALRCWPRRLPEPAQSGRHRLALRVVLSAGFTFLVISSAGRIGPGLAGLAAALPVMSLIMAFVTHQEHGATATNGFLQGVAKGSFSYVASIFAFTELLRSGNIWLAFVVALAVALVVQLAVQYVDSRPALKRVLSTPLLGPNAAFGPPLFRRAVSLRPVVPTSIARFAPQRLRLPKSGSCPVAPT